jgi:hypothetical protein
MRSLLYLTGRTPSPFPTEPEQISLPLTFKAAFAGAKTVYALAIDTASLNDGWRTEGMLERALVVSRKGLRLMAERPKAASGIHSPGG